MTNRIRVQTLQCAISYIGVFMLSNQPVPGFFWVVKGFAHKTWEFCSSSLWNFTWPDVRASLAGCNWHLGYRKSLSLASHPNGASTMTLPHPRPQVPPLTHTNI